MDATALSAFIDANILVTINNDIDDHAVALYKVVRTCENGQLKSATTFGVNPNGGFKYKFTKGDIKNSRPYAFLKTF